MTTFKAQGYKERREKVPPFEIHVTSYKAGKVYHCSVDNVSPGAVISRAEGKTRGEAEAIAVGKAKDYLSRTRVLPG